MSNKLKASIGVLLVFVLGILAGSFGTQAYMKYRASHFLQRGYEERAERFLGRLTRDLDLTAAQQAEIGEIVRESHRKLAQISRRCRPEIQGIIERDFAMIRRILTDEQREKFAQFQGRFDQRGRHRTFRKPLPTPPCER
jgi:Spy/CpxP family protein refolding chaperone